MNKTSTTSVHEAIKRYQSSLNATDYARLLDLANEPAPIAVRVNHLKSAQPQAFLANLAARYGWVTKPVVFFPEALTIESADIAPGQTLEHRMGQYYVQDAASMLPVSLFSKPEPTVLTLDMAASPGGKTTQLVDLNLDRGLVVANDATASRLPALKTVMSLWGAGNLAITNFPGENLGDWLPNTFDRVLLDAPCSMEGLRDSPSHPFRPISETERERLANRQLNLLISALKSAKIGAEIVYSTCTLAPEEDEMVVNALLKRYPGAVEIIPQPHFASAQGLSSFAGQEFETALKHAIRVWPFSFGTNGFFSVKLLKTAAIPTDASLPPGRPFTSTGLAAIRKEGLSQIQKFLQDELSLDFERVLTDMRGILFQRQGQVFLIPEAWLTHFATFPYHSLGMPVGKLLKGLFEPSTDLFNRWNHLIQERNWLLPQQWVETWLRGGDVRGSGLPGVPKSGFVIVRDELGRYLGAGKVIPGRVRNLLSSRNLIM